MWDTCCAYTTKLLLAQESIRNFIVKNKIKAEPWRQQTGVALGLRDTEGRLSWGRFGIRPQLESLKSGTSCICKENSIINSNIWQDVVFDPFCYGLWKTLWKGTLGNTESFSKNRHAGGEWREAAGEDRKAHSLFIHMHCNRLLEQCSFNE